VRLRYEIRREFAPYVGLAWTSKFGQRQRSLEQTTSRSAISASLLEFESGGNVYGPGVVLAVTSTAMTLTAADSES